VHDTYFVVAHLHYVLIGGAVFPLFAAFHYWFPKMMGRMMGEGLGKLSFGLMFIGFNIAFFPMHWLGLHGMPRRVYTYQSGMGWDQANLLSTIGAVTLATGVFVSLVNAIRSARHGELAPADPWGGGTLEWATSSPPPPCNFYAMPVVHGRDPVWQPAPDGEAAQVSGLSAVSREILVTTVIDARPDTRLASPQPSAWPFLTAVATTLLFIGSIFSPWNVIWGSAIVSVACICWFWPRRQENSQDLALEQRPS
jgi:cytochrome c oxidase subunit 1